MEAPFSSFCTTADELIVFFHEELERSLDVAGAKQISAALDLGVDLDDILSAILAVLQVNEEADEECISAETISCALRRFKSSDELTDLRAGVTASTNYTSDSQELMAAEDDSSFSGYQDERFGLSQQLPPEADIPEAVTALSGALRELRDCVSCPVERPVFCEESTGVWRMRVTPETTCDLWRNRLARIYWNLKAENRFTMAVEGGGASRSVLDSDSANVLPQVWIGEQIVGVENKKTWLLGILRSATNDELEDHRTWYIEHLNRVEVDLSRAVCADDSFIGDGHFVLAQGVLSQNVFHAMRLQQPCTRVHPMRLALHQERVDAALRDKMAELRAVPKPLINALRWVIINNATFDSKQRLEYLTTIFDHYETKSFDVSDPAVLWDALDEDESGEQTKWPMPVGFILIGNFSTYCPDEVYAPTATLRTTLNYGRDNKMYLDTWQHFFKLLNDHPKVLQSCKVIVVPGLNDPGVPLLPRGPICSPMRCYVDSEWGGGVHFVGNPCVVASQDVEMQFVRANLSLWLADRTYLWHRPAVFEEEDTILDATAKERTWQSVVSTVVGQSLLLPLPDTYPARTSVLNADRDTSLYLSDRDLIVFNDRFMPFRQTKVGRTTLASVPDTAIYDVTTQKLTEGWK